MVVLEVEKKRLSLGEKRGGGKGLRQMWSEATQLKTAF